MNYEKNLQIQMLSLENFTKCYKRIHTNSTLSLSESEKEKNNLPIYFWGKYPLIPKWDRSWKAAKCFNKISADQIRAIHKELYSMTKENLTKDVRLIHSLVEMNQVYHNNRLNNKITWSDQLMQHKHLTKINTHLW